MRRFCKYNGYLILLVLFFGFALSQFAFSQSKEEKDWIEIKELYALGWKEKEQNTSDWESRFRGVAKKTIQFRSKYTVKKNETRYLRATILIAYFKELGNLDSEAANFYNESLTHPKISDAEALIGNTKISLFARKRLQEIVARTSAAKNSQSKTYPKISIKGGSKGGPRELPDRIKELTSP